MKIQFKRPNDRIIFAGDFSTVIELMHWSKLLGPHVGAIKVGLEAINAKTIGGPEAIRIVHGMNAQCFYDIKLNDIPQTVGKASANISDQDVWAFNLHACAGAGAIEAAVKNAFNGKKDHKSLVLGVTVLTSISPDECNTEIFGHMPPVIVERFAKKLLEKGADGIICSPQEAKALRYNPLYDEMLIVTPGIRNADAPPDDQKRTMTAAEAIEAGADMLVIGRPISQATDPVAAVQRFALEIAAAKPFQRETAL